MAGWIREYAATFVVALCVLLVALINLSAAGDASGSLFDALTGVEKKTDPLKNKMLAENSRKKNLATAPLTSAVSAVADYSTDEANYYEAEGYAVYEPQPTLENQILLAIAGPQTPAGSKERKGARTYEVRDGDTVGSIAAANGVSATTVLSANNLSETSLIRPGDKLTILPITGATYKVQKGDTLEAIAKKYNSDSQKILAYNELAADGNLKEGQSLVIPDGYLSPAVNTGTRLAIAGQPQTAASGSSLAPIKLSGGGSGHRFPYGYCTWYVAQRRYVPWGGNAGTWLSGARAAGRATGSTPRPGAIIVTGESRWGHVGIVEKVSGNSVTISEMNYAGFGRKSTRTISASSRVVKGFIY